MLRAAVEAGADVAVLCDTNGGRLPDEVADVVHAVREATSARLGIHCHNDAGCAVANSLAAVDAGATHVQGTLNGYGERTGNADILTVVANLELKRGAAGAARRACSRRRPGSRTRCPSWPTCRRTPVSRTSVRRRSRTRPGCTRAPSGSTRCSTSTSEPADVGNDMRMLVSDMAGRASIELKGRELGYDLSGNDELLGRVTEKVKDMESRGYTFEAADASFELLLRAEVEGSRPDFFEVESWRVIVDAHDDAHTEGTASSEATVKVRAGGERRVAVGEGNGPVNALDHALRAALGSAYPELAKLELIDYRVRIVDAAHGTDAVTRVLVETSDGETSWETVGVHANIIEASWEALLDAVTYGLLRHRGAVS